MKNSEKNQNAPDILADFDDEVTARIENGPAAVEEAPTSDLSVNEAAPADSVPAVEIEEVPAAEPLPETSEPAVETPTTEPVVEERSEPQYGAPQPLFEDIIPAGFAIDEEKKKAAEERAARVAAEAAEREAKEAEAARKREEKEAEAARKKAEKEAAKEAKLQAKEDKKRAKTAALIARVEAEAEQKAKREIEKETGEPYELPSAKPEAPAEAPVLAAVVPVPAEAPIQEVPATEEAEPEAAAPAAPAAQPERAPAPAEVKAENPAPVRQYSSYERRLRRKYKIDKDPLLKENDVVPGFVIAKGEHVIRSYDCLASSKGDGILCLTNKRLLINAGERSEIGIDKVSGIKFSKYSRLSFLKFIFWLFFFGLGAFMVALPFVQSGMNIPFITGDSWKDWFTYLFYACGGVSVVISIPLFFSMLKKTFYFYVYAREESPFLEYKSRAYAKREKKGKVYKYTITKAGRESEKAARELGALIIEAKEGRYDD